eukprot:365525-Chlamydomonas_euryale.AAC.3
MRTYGAHVPVSATGSLGWDARRSGGRGTARVLPVLPPRCSCRDGRGGGRVHSCGPLRAAALARRALTTRGHPRVDRRRAEFKAPSPREAAGPQVRRRPRSPLRYRKQRRAATACPTRLTRRGCAAEGGGCCRAVGCGVMGARGCSKAMRLRVTAGGQP